MKKLKYLMILALFAAGCSGSSGSTAAQSSAAENSASSETAETPAATNTDVTESNFTSFPETSADLFSYDAYGEGIAITGCSSEDAVIVVPAKIDGQTVVGIGSGAIVNKANCQAIVLPDTVEWVDENAFTNDTTLKYIELGSGLKEIGNMAFNNCASLAKIRFPESLEYFGMCLPMGETLTDIWLSASVTDFYDGISNPTSNPNLVVHTPAGSEAEAQAKQYGLPVENDY